MTSLAHNQHSDMLQELKQIRQLLDETRTSLQQQKAELKSYGMSLPPLVLMTLQAVQAELSEIEQLILEEQTELTQLRALAQMSAKITTSLDVDTVLQETMDIVIALTRAERGYIILLDPETQELEFRVSREDIIGSPSREDQPQISRSILNEVMRSGEALLADNAFQDERLQGNQSIANFALRSVLCVPLAYKGGIIGAVYVDNRFQTGVFTSRELTTLIAFANTAAVAIANARLYADIQRLLSEITQVKELMDNVFTSIGSGIIATDASDLVTTINRTAEQMLSLPAQVTIGRHINTVLPKISADLTDYFDTVRQRGESHFIEGELNTARGRIAITMKLSPLKDSQRLTRGVAVVVDDVTEKTQREQQLRLMKNYLPPEMVDNIHTISRLALGGERREVTCIFVDVLPLAVLRRTPPHEAMALLNRFLSVATQCIHNSGGIIDKYMGQEVMVLFNTQLNPQAHHANLALECALNMRDAFIALYASLGVEPDPHYYRIGMHSGIATLGNVGSLNRRDFTAIGDTINLAKRLEENAQGGQIIISDETRLQLAAPIQGLQLSEGPALQVKGRQQATRIYEVTRS